MLGGGASRQTVAVGREGMAISKAHQMAERPESERWYPKYAPFFAESE